MYKELLYSMENGVANIVLKSASPDNKLNDNNVNELIAALKQAVKDDNRVVVITGMDDLFCGGGTIGDFRLLSSTEINDFGVLLGDMVMTLKTLPIPVIGAINGNANGGGLSLMEACDIKVAVEEATFAIPEIKGGFCPAVALVSVQHSLGNVMAQNMAMTGDSINAAKALDIGLVQRVVKKADLEKIVSEEAAKVVNGNPTAYRVTKEIAFKLSEQTLRNSFTIATGKLVEFLASEDAKEVLNANGEGREKKYTCR